MRSEIRIDFHLQDKLEAVLHTFADPGAFATVDLLSPNGNRVTFFIRDIAYARALADAVNRAGAGAGAEGPEGKAEGQAAWGKVIYTKTSHME